MTEYDLDLNSVPTIVTLTVNNQENGAVQISDQCSIMNNLIIKTLSDGSLCILDRNELNLTENGSVVFSDSVPNLTPQTQVTANPFEYSFPESLQVTPVLTLPERNEQDPQQADVENESPKIKSAKYKCATCKEEFSKHALYTKHILQHLLVKKYKCDKCSMSYNVESNLQLHMAMHAEGKPACPLCNTSFQRLASLKSHLMLHQVEELYTCEECGAEFEREEELSRHWQTHRNPNNKENDELICTYCKIKLDDRPSFKEHITHHIQIKKMVLSRKKTKRKHGGRGYRHVCGICQKSFSRASMLDRHARIHSGERPYVCDVCNRGFNQKGTLQIHKSKHTNIKPFHCTLCTARFNQKGNLRAHAEKTHSAPTPGVKTYKCAHCSCLFKRIASLNVHMSRVHASDKEQPLSIPDLINQLKKLEQQTTSTEPKLMDEKIAEQDKKIIEDIKLKGVPDNVSFVRLAESFIDGSVRRYLVKLKKVNDTRLFVCHFCSKEFKKPSDLMRHYRVHTKEKPYMCKQCGAVFALKSTLLTHTKMHVGTRFLCTICDTLFTSIRALTAHLGRHSKKPIKKFKCRECTKSFSTVEKLKAHEIAHKLYTKNIFYNIISNQPLLQAPDGLVPLSIAKKSKTNTTSDDKLQKCPHCDYKTPHGPNLRRHVQLHTGNKMFKCDQCPKSYSTEYRLRNHSLHHSGVKDYLCNECGKQFPTRDLFRAHSISHTNERPFLCPHCRKAFKSLLVCKNHIRRHLKHKLLQAKSSGETEEINDVTESDNNNVLQSPPDAYSKAQSTQGETEVTYAELGQPLNESSKGQGNKVYQVNPSAETVEVHHFTESDNSNVLQLTRDTYSKTHDRQVENDEHLATEQPTKVKIEMAYTGINKPEDFLSKGQADVVYQSVIHDATSNKDDPPPPYDADNIASNDSAQIMPENENDSLNNTINQDSNVQIHTIYINCEDLGIPETIKMTIRPFDSSSANQQSQLMSNSLLSNADSFIFNTINDLEDVNVFNVDSMNGDFSAQTGDIYGSNQIFNINQFISNDQPSTSSATIVNNNQINDSGSPKIVSALDDGRAMEETNILTVDAAASDFIPHQIADKSPTQDLLVNSVADLPKTDLNLSSQNIATATADQNFSVQLSIPSPTALMPNLTNFNLSPNLDAVSDLPLEQNLNFAALDLVESSKLARVSQIARQQRADGEFQKQEEEEEGEKEKDEAAAAKDKKLKIKKKYHCSQCRKVFVNRHVYSRHLVSHSGGSSAKQCTFCPKQFKKQSDCIRHIRTHTGERPFPCDQCGKRFTLKSTLVTHQRIHNPTEKKDNNCCRVCNSYFSSRSSLTTHMHIHTGNFPHQCGYCDLKFRTAAHKKSHETTHLSNSTRIKGLSKVEEKINMLASVAMEGIDLGTPAQHMPNSTRLNENSKSDDQINMLASSIAMEGITDTNDRDQILSAATSLPPIIDQTDPPITDLDNVLVVQDQQLNDMILNEEDPLADSIHLDPGLLLQQLQSSNFLYQDHFNPSSLIQLDDGTLLNVKTVYNDLDLDDINLKLPAPPPQQQQQQQQILQQPTHPLDGEHIVFKQGVITIAKPRNLECDICHKMYASKDVLRKHRKLHGINRKFPCTQCDKGFDTAEALDNHEKVHAGLRPFACKHCKNSFAKEHSLVAHMKSFQDAQDVYSYLGQTICH